MTSNAIEPIIFSVLIPVYNAEKHIEKCLESIASQIFRNYEVIIQDGGSTDRTLEILDSVILKFPSMNLRIFQEKDTGPYDAMNKAITRAKGTWLLFLGSDDDLYNERVLEEVFPVLSKTEALLVYGNVKINGESGWARQGQIYDGEFSIEKLFKTNISHQAIFYHKTIFPKLGHFNTDYVVCADWDLNHRCFANIKTRFIDLIIANFFAGGISTVNQSDRYFVFDRIINLKKYYSISYTNPLFKSSAWTFYSNAKKEFSQKSYLRSLRFLFFSFYHSQMKFGLFKTCIRDILRSGKKFKLV